MHFYSSSSDDAHYYQDALANHNVLKNLISDYEENKYYKEQNKKFKCYNCYVCLYLLLFIIAISYSALYLYEYYNPEMLHIDSNHTNHTNSTKMKI